MSLNPALEDASFCPRCAAPATVSLPRSLHCETCGYAAFFNPKPVGCALARDGEGRVWLARRGHDPGRWRWSMPGGFVELGETILHHPETGFNESKTSALVAETMQRLGLEPQTGLALTGVKGRLKGARPGPRLAFIGELDSLRTSDHPHADPHTGAAHSCGHNAQVAGMLGVAMGIAGAGNTGSSTARRRRATTSRSPG